MTTPTATCLTLPEGVRGLPGTPKEGSPSPQPPPQSFCEPPPCSPRGLQPAWGEGLWCQAKASPRGRVSPPAAPSPACQTAPHGLPTEHHPSLLGASSPPAGASHRHSRVGGGSQEPLQQEPMLQAQQCRKPVVTWGGLLGEGTGHIARQPPSQ